MSHNGPTSPPVERDRLAALRRSGVLDSPAEPSFDRLTRLAARLLGCPVALVSLVDADRQFFKSAVGLPEPWASRRETPLSHSFCRRVVERREPLVIPDARLDPLFRGNAAIRDLQVVAYLGIPLVTAGGHVLGSFCAIDSRPREWTGDDVRTMEDLAASVVSEVALREEVAERRRAEDVFRVTLASVGDAVIATDTAGKIAFLNPVAEALTGWSQDEAVGVAIGEVFRVVAGPTSRPIDGPGADGSHEGGAVADERHPVLVARDGTERPVVDTTTLIRDAGGDVLGAVVVCRDDSQRRSAELALKKSEENFRAVFELAGVGKAQVHPKTGHFLRANPYLCAFLGYEEGQLLRMTFLDLTHPDDCADDFEHFQRMARGEISEYTKEKRYVRADGVPVWASVNARMIRDTEGRALRTISVIVDINDRKRVEDELRRARDSAEEATRAKDQFIAMLSHELRNPLTPVLLMATDREHDPRTPEDLRETFTMIRQSVELEVRLIDDLLDVMKIIRGKMPYRFETADLHTLVERTAEICRGEVDAKGITLELDLGARRHHVRADPARLQQALWNLVKNAVKFTPDGGRVVVRSRDGDHRKVALEVSDTGIGIEPSQLPKIFNAFEQVEDAITHQFGGLGLGLAITLSVAEAHGGRLTASSEGRGLGATFSLELATVAPGSARVRPEDPAEEPAEADRDLRILLVEDDPMSARVMSRLLRQVGYTVTSVNSIAGALAVPLGEVDVLVCDLGLPDGSGLDLMRAIKARRDIPGIALTGFGALEDIRRGRDAGFVAHLTKPIDFAKLSSMIHKVGAGVVAR